MKFLWYLPQQKPRLNNSGDWLMLTESLNDLTIWSEDALNAQYINVKQKQEHDMHLLKMQFSTRLSYQ